MASLALTALLLLLSTATAAVDPDRAAADDPDRQRLAKAIEGNDVEAMRAAVSALGSVDAPDADGLTGLHDAAAFGKPDCLVVLLQLGADVNRRGSSEEFTALHLAAMYNHDEALAVLLAAAGVEIGATDKHGKTALHAAAENGMAEAATTLLKAGVDLQAKDHGGKRAVEYVEFINSMHAFDCLR